MRKTDIILAGKSEKTALWGTICRKEGILI
jgi:hypothetical protein